MKSDSPRLDPQTITSGRNSALMKGDKIWYSSPTLERRRITAPLSNYSIKDPYDLSPSHTTNHSPALLIVGYLRTGSTFTASLFAQHPRTFYVFEPLHMITEQIKKYRTLRYVDGAVRRFPTGVTPESAIEESLGHWIRCAFARLDRDSLQDHFHYHYSKSMRPLVACLRQRVARLNGRFYFALRECLPPVVKKCNEAELRVFKTIRLRMSSAKKLMSEFPNLKVIHLVRDPRGMVNSQFRNGLLRRGYEALKIRGFCSEMMADIAISKRLLQAREKNFYAIRYEDIAYDPLYQAEKLYNFVGLQAGSHLKTYILQNTSLNLTDSCAFCTRRGNSTRTANKWRDNINLPLVKIVDQYCSPVYESLGYLKLGITDIRNQSVPSMIPGSIYDVLRPSENYRDNGH